jgi:hypothetical protein
MGNCCGRQSELEDTTPSRTQPSARAMGPGRTLGGGSAGLEADPRAAAALAAKVDPSVRYWTDYSNEKKELVRKVGIWQINCSRTNVNRDCSGSQETQRERSPRCNGIDMEKLSAR